jgi:hypothetical protein
MGPKNSSKILKAPLKMECIPYSKSSHGHKTTLRDGKCSLSIIPFGPFFASWNFGAFCATHSK